MLLHELNRSATTTWCPTSISPSLLSNNNLPSLSSSNSRLSIPSPFSSTSSISSSIPSQSSSSIVSDFTSDSTAPRSLFAAGTSAAIVNNSFDTDASLEIYSIAPGSDRPNLVAKTGCKDRLHSIAWGASNGNPGLIAGGMNAGISIWDADKALKGSDSLVTVIEKHSGPVQTLDFNHHQSHLLASGSSKSEVFVWDLVRPDAPTVYTPGTAVGNDQEDTMCVSWNRLFPHILASSPNAGKCVVWDLKNRRPVVTFVDPKNKQARIKAIIWNPEVALHAITISEDDSCPDIQLWDLRQSFSPASYLQGHSKGVWSASWNTFDSSLLLSTGKDNRTICWDIKNGHAISDVDTGSNWNFDVKWNPIKPSIFSTSSLEGRVQVHMLHDVNGKNVGALSPGADPFTPISYLSKPANWTGRKNCTAFGWGGKLITIKQKKSPTDQALVHISTIVQENDLVDQTEKLQQIIQNNDFESFCNEKIVNAKTPEDVSIWSLVMCHLKKTDSRGELLSTLGFDQSQISQIVEEFIQRTPSFIEKIKQEEEALQQKKAQVQVQEPEKKEEVAEKVESTIPSLSGGGDQKGLHELFAGQTDDPFSFSPRHPFGNESINNHAHIENDTEHVHEEIKAPQLVTLGHDDAPFQILTNKDEVDDMITRSVMIGNFDHAVELCICLGRMADALLLSECGSAELKEKTRDTYLRYSTPRRNYLTVFESILKGQIASLIEMVDLGFWKEALVIICTYVPAESFGSLCELLGDRLAQSGQVKLSTACYICSGNFDKVIQNWANESANNPKPYQALHDLVEKITIYKQAISFNDVSDKMIDIYCAYAEILASQGQIDVALKFISFLGEPKYANTKGAILLDRLVKSQETQPQQQNNYLHQSNQYQTSPYSTPFPQQNYYGTEKPAAVFPGQFIQMSSNAGESSRSTSLAAKQIPPISFVPTVPAVPTTPFGFNPTPAAIPPPVVPSPFPGTATGAIAPQPAAPSLPPPPTGMPSTRFTRQVQTTTILPPANVFTPKAPSTTAPPLPGVSTSTSASTAPVAQIQGVPMQKVSSMPPTGSYPMTTVPAPGSVTPPPIARQFNPPAPSSFGMTPANITPPVAAAATPVSSPAPEPMGDAKRIIDNLTTVLQKISQKSPKNAKWVEEATKKIAPLYTKLARGEISPPVITSLLQLSQSFLNIDGQTESLLNVVITHSFSEIGSGPLVILKNILRYSN